MKIILLGYGNVGKELEKVLNENGIAVDLIIRSVGIFDTVGFLVDEKENFLKYIDEDTTIFISIPSKGDDPENVKYYQDILSRGASIITCEKGVLAYRWDLFGEKIRYSAAVGGGSGILNAVSDYQGEIKEIKAVVNGTLNYIDDQLYKGRSEEEILKEVLEKGFAEPGANTFDEVIKGELKDVTYKTVILANHSKLYERIIKPEDISITGYEKGKRCAVFLNKEGIKAGFVADENDPWFPEGVNNVLYINGEKIVEGPGAGARATAERMFKDFK